MRWAAPGVIVLVLVGAWIWWSSAGAPSGCPRTLARAAPATLDEAAALIAGCSAGDIRARLRGAPLPELVSRRTVDLPPAAWLAPESSLSRELSGLGFRYADDMSFAVLSSAWHQARRLPFDARALAACLQAWNEKMQLWVASVAPGSTVPAPEFSCASAEEIEKGRPLWPPR